MPTPMCPLCRDTRIVRMRRSRPLARVIGLLGYYPWNCENCGHHFMLRDRGRVRSEAGNFSAQRQTPPKG